MTLLWRLFHRIAGARHAPVGDTVDILVMDPFDGPVYAVGDVHGRLDLYLAMEAAILNDASAFPGPATIVLLGDLIDRGPQTAALIDHLLRPLPGTARRLVLMGNHEAMMLAFLAAPRRGGDWLFAGGHETLASYGVTLDLQTLARLNERKLRQVLAAHLPERHIALMWNALPGVQIGRYLLAHAGADAAAPLSAQPRDALLWGTAGLSAPSGLTLVHGHYVTAAPVCEPHRIGIDTGAYATGHLTVLRLIDGHPPAVLTSPATDGFRPLSPTS